MIQDEARHVAYGVLALRDHYGDMKESEVKEREDFVYEAAVLMRDRFLFQQVWEKVGLPVKECMDIAMHNEGQKQFRQILFSKIVPAIKRIGLLSERQRQRFDELGILQFENWQDPFESLKQSEEEIAREQRLRNDSGQVAGSASAPRAPSRRGRRTDSSRRGATPGRAPPRR